MRIKSSASVYEVQFSEDLAPALAALAEVKDKVFCVDRNVMNQVRPHLGNSEVYVLNAVEEEKSLAGTERLLLWMQAQGLHRGSTMVAIGGGITQDIVAFASHTYFRGIPWWFLPTTLLSQADSCIGSKYGVNLGGRKNQVGNYYPPQRVFVATQFLKSLPLRDIMSGYGEIFRLMWTGSQKDFDHFVKHFRPGDLINQNLKDFIRRGLEIKQAVIEKDEFEKDLRRILNYGHTFGHALEAVTDHRIPHGLAVVWGMDLIDSISRQMGLLSADFQQSKRTSSKKIFTSAFQAIPGIDSILRQVQAKDLLDVIKFDKKTSRDQILLVLNAGPGDLRVIKTAIDQKLLGQIEVGLQELQSP